MTRSMVVAIVFCGIAIATVAEGLGWRRGDVYGESVGYNDGVYAAIRALPIEGDGK